MMFKISDYFVVKFISKRKVILIYDDTNRIEYILGYTSFFVILFFFSTYLFLIFVI
jgi:hypothetical protein